MTPEGGWQRLAGIISDAGLERTARRGLWRVAAGGNEGLLHLARSRHSSAAELTLAPKLAVVSSTLVAVFGEPRSVEPEPYVHHWYRSSIYLHEQSDDAAWTGIETANPPSWDAAAADLRDRLIPTLEEHLTDDGLRRCWTEHDDPWLPPLVQWTYLALLERRANLPSLQRSIERIRRVLDEAADETPGAEWARPGLRSLGV